MNRVKLEMVWRLSYCMQPKGRDLLPSTFPAKLIVRNLVLQIEVQDINFKTMAAYST